MTVRVRRAGREHLPALLGLFGELDRLQRDWRVFTPRPGVTDEVSGKYRDALSHRDVLVAVAEDGPEVVGMAVGEPRTPSRFSDERSLEVSGVIVRQDRRREGIGRLLMQEAVRFARERGPAGSRCARTARTGPRWSSGRASGSVTGSWSWPAPSTTWLVASWTTDLPIRVTPGP